MKTEDEIEKERSANVGDYCKMSQWALFHFSILHFHVVLVKTTQLPCLKHLTKKLNLLLN